MFKHIFVPLDGSLRAEQALPVAARIAQVEEGSLCLVRVISPAIDFSGGLAPVPAMSEQALKAELSAATEYLKALTASPAMIGIEMRTEVLSGVPAFSLVTAIEASEADLIALCSHGRTGFSRWALGSIAHALVHQSSVPVLVLRQNKPLVHIEHCGPISALVSLDGSQLSEAVLEPAAHLVAALATPGKGKLHLTQVIGRAPAQPNKHRNGQMHEEVLKETRVYLADVVERMQPLAEKLKLTITTSVECASDVATALVDMAQHDSKKVEGEDASSYDLIAMSTHGRGALERLVLGSVTERVIATTALPMLIVRPLQKD